MKYEIMPLAPDEVLVPNGKAVKHIIRAINDIFISGGSTCEYRDVWKPALGYHRPETIEKAIDKFRGCGWAVRQSGECYRFYRQEETARAKPDDKVQDIPIKDTANEEIGTDDYNIKASEILEAARSYICCYLLDKDLRMGAQEVRDISLTYNDIKTKL